MINGNDIINIDEKGDNYDEEQEILDSSYWVKGLETVDFSKMRVTNLKGNRRFIIPGPVKNGCFELKWRNVEVECVEATKRVKGVLDKKYKDRQFYNISTQEENGLNKLVERMVCFLDSRHLCYFSSFLSIF